jgi:predicted small lipoprotein YifL
MKKRLSILLAVCLAMLSLAACGKSGSENAPAGTASGSAGDASKTVTLSIAMHVSNVKEQEPYMYGIIQKFQEKYPNIKIDLQGAETQEHEHNPYGSRWGAMHWGHAKSKDLVHWEHLPIALAPSELYELHERGGCFSGSAVDDNGVLTLLYTATVLKDGQLIQTQCLATSDDGITFEKYGPGSGTAASAGFVLQPAGC